MVNRHAIRTIAIASSILVVLCTGVAHADLSFAVSANTSSLSGQSGYLDFQFNPGDSSALAATATVTNYVSTGGILAPSAILTGDAVGVLPGTLTLDNGTIFNDVFQGFTFGNTVNFTLTLSGPAVNNPGGTIGSAFAFSLYAADGVTPLLTTDPNGSVATINLNADGTTSALTFAQSPTDNTPAASVSTMSAVPEPSTGMMAIVFCSLQGGLCVLSRWRLTRRLRYNKITT